MNKVTRILDDHVPTFHMSTVRFPAPRKPNFKARDALLVFKRYKRIGTEQ
ncbi:MAG: hypothetical protein V5B30_12705 [Candidatus Accumulibacter delftensis]|jgi:hypothetical protein